MATTPVAVLLNASEEDTAISTATMSGQYSDAVEQELSQNALENGINHDEELSVLGTLSHLSISAMSRLSNRGWRFRFRLGRISRAIRHYRRSRFFQALLMLGILLAGVSSQYLFHVLRVSHSNRNHGGTITFDPLSYVTDIERFKRVFSCTKALSPSLLYNEGRIVQSSLGRYFITAAQNLELTRCNSWDSDFGIILALWTLRESMQIPRWDAPVQHARDVCYWKRLRCNEELKVSVISLNHLDNLTGTIPTEIGGLIHLTHLFAYSNRNLVGTIPSEIANLRNLEAFQVQDTGLSGAIPNVFGEMSALTSLLIDRTFLSGKIPDSLCQRDVQIHIDCSRVQCSCCTCRSQSPG